MYKETSSSEDIDSFANAFPALMQKEEENVIERILPLDEEVFYLWDSSEDIFRIYKIVINYLNENYSIDSSILIELIKANSMNMEETLHDIPYLHSSYVEVIFPVTSTGNEENGS